MTRLLTGYHDTAFNHDRRQIAVKRVCETLRRYPREVGIVCTGLSGILVAVPAAELTKREFAIVRKPGEKNHSNYVVEGYTFSEYVIVDDFVDEGKTLQRLLRIMSNRWGMPDPPVCKGIILYDNSPMDFSYKGQEIPVIGLDTT